MNHRLSNHDDKLKQKIISWGYKTISSLGYEINIDADKTIQDTPWSYVACYETENGRIYLKHMPKQLALESTITMMLRNQFHAPVPEIIATNSKLDCFLMKDTGISLQSNLKKQFDINFLVKAIDEFTILQLSVANHINDFLKIGVPDWRLNKLPGLFNQLLENEKLLITDGLSKEEINTLKSHQSIITDLCEKLSHYNIKQTFVQCDFHDNNILIDKLNKLTFIDLGETAISHPFFSLIGFLRQVKKHHKLTNNDTDYLLLVDTCYKNYKDTPSKIDLYHAFDIAKKLWLIYEVLAQHRLMLACGTETIMDFQQGKMANVLREFINENIT